MAAILALDQGTTSSRALVFDTQARVLGLSQREFAQHYPRPGWIEHDPDELWTTQLQTAQDALRSAGVTARDVAAVGIANQRETTILWDRTTGEPVANAIVWQDRRTGALCEELARGGLGETVAQKTGLLLDPYFSAGKIRWLLDTVPGLRDRAQRGEIAFGTVDTWLVWKLTGGRRHVTDVTNASRTMLFDIHRLCWDEELCRGFDIPPAILPQVLPSTAAFGVTESDLFGAPVAVCGVAGDQQAALAGQAGFDAGLAKNTYGTGSFVMLNTGERVVRSTHGMLSTIALGLELGRVTYALEGSVFVTGAAVQWLRDGLGLIADASEIETLAAQAHDAGGVRFVPAFTGLGAPYWDPRARGTILGITRGTTRAHIARAALEAVAFQCADVIEAMQHDSGIALTELRVDGGGSANALTMQFQADLLGVPVVRPRITETTALGAAYLAGIQSGFWPSTRTAAELWREDARFEPRMTGAQRQTLMRDWRRAVERSRNWIEPAFDES